MKNVDLTLLSAVAAAEMIRDGRLMSEALVTAYLKRIEESEAEIKAWAFLDAELALEQAREADRIRKIGHATGALHGIPVGLKDIVDTSDMPTERGSDVFKGRSSGRDARLVERLREAGAVVMGKTKTTEFAYMHPTDTTNPHDPLRSPGGSSSGSAAAVAARHVPLAVGTQTGGSVIRPASFCGTYGFKPTRGVIPRTGVFRTSVSLDQVGVMANSIEDVALIGDVLSAYDQDDPASFARPRPELFAGARAEAQVEPDIVWFDLPFNDRLESETREGFEAVIEALGSRVERFETAPQLAELPDVHKVIYDYEISENISKIAAENDGKISEEMLGALTRAKEISKAQYEDALAVKATAESFFKNLFNDYDAILAPSATGEAPLISEGHTGDSIFCLIWTFAGLPCLTMPVLVGKNDLPVGLQLIGAAEEDDRLMRTASWVQTNLMQNAEPEEG